MVSINVAIPENREPWLIPVGNRISLFHQAIRLGKKINMMIYDHADTSTFRYRCYNLQQWTQESDDWQVVYFFRHEMELCLPLLNKANLLTLVRLQWFHSVDRFIHSAHLAGIPVIYDVDDRIFDLEALPLLTNSIAVDFSVEGQYEYWFSYISRNGYTAQKVDGFTTTNEYLGCCLRDKFGKDYQVIRNSLNYEQLEVSRKCCEAKAATNKYMPILKKGRGSRDKKFVIGYFSGSPSHNNDLALISSELALFLEKHDDAILKVVGFMQFPSILQQAINRGQVIIEPLTDFLNLQVLTAEVDVNIVPLLENTFTNCKSELKFFEAAIVNTLTIASPIYSYAHSIRDGENGYLCSPGQWYERLEYVYQHYDDQKLLIEQAHKDCIEEYAGRNFIRELEKVFNSFSKLTICNNSKQ